MLIMTYLNETTTSPHNHHDHVLNTVNTGKEDLFMRGEGGRGKGEGGIFAAAKTGEGGGGEGEGCSST